MFRMNVPESEQEATVTLRRRHDLASRLRRSVRVPTLRSLILLALYGLFVLWMCMAVMIHLGELVDAPPRYPYGDKVFLVSIDAWALAAAGGFGFILLNPFRWLNGKRLIFGCMALAAMLGRLAGGSLAYLLVFTPIPGWLLFVASPFALLSGGVTVILAIFLIVGAVFGFFIAIPVMLFRQILEFDHAVTIYRYQARGLAGYIIRAVYWLRNEPLPAAPPDDSKGARFATYPEIVKLHRPVAEAMAFGHIRDPLFIHTDKHVLIMASTRSGKGVSLIIPHLLRYRGSAFVLDPKGENAKATGRQRAQLNGRVHYLDPFGISGKPQSRFNPLARFTPQNMEAESKALAAALFVVGERERDHWTASAQQLVATLVLFVYLSPDSATESKDLPRVRRLLLASLQGTLDDMVKLTSPHDPDRLLADLAMSFIVTPEKEFGSIVSTAQRQTEILDNPYIVACLSARGVGPEVDFKAWHSGTMTVFLCLSAPKFPTFNRWLRLLLTSALDEMTDTLDPPKLPVCFMLDELATLGHLATVENAVGLAAGYGIQLVTVFQDVAQMRDLYKGRWASFIGNAGVRVLFNLDDYETAEYWSKFVGSRQIETHSRQENIYGLSSGQNVGETMHPLLPTDQLMFDFASGKMLVLAQGAHPVITDRVPYYDDTGLKGLWDDPRLPATPRAAPPRPPSSAPVRAAPSPQGPRPAAPSSSPAPAPPPAQPPRSPAAAAAPSSAPVRAAEHAARPTAETPVAVTRLRRSSGFASKDMPGIKSQDGQPPAAQDRNREGGAPERDAFAELEDAIIHQAKKVIAERSQTPARNGSAADRTASNDVPRPVPTGEMDDALRINRQATEAFRKRMTDRVAQDRFKPKVRPKRDDDRDR